MRVLENELLTREWYVELVAPLVPGVVFPGTRVGRTEPGIPGIGFSIKDFYNANIANFRIFVSPNERPGLSVDKSSALNASLYLL